MEKPKYLGEFEQFILLSVMRLQDDAYGTQVKLMLSELIQREVTIGALYTTLDRLEKKGLLTSHMGEATAERGGRAKKYFVITGDGVKALKQSKQALTRMWEGMSFKEVM